MGRIFSDLNFRVGILAICALRMTDAAVIYEPPPECRDVDLRDAAAIVRCIEAEHPTPALAEVLQRSAANLSCDVVVDILLTLMNGGTGLTGVERKAADKPSCEVVAGAVTLLNGEAWAGSACLGYDPAEIESHAPACIESHEGWGEGGMPPSSFMAGGFGTCSKFLKTYEEALRAASASGETPTTYERPGCDRVAEIMTTWTGGRPDWADCADYDPDSATHLEACLRGGSEEIASYTNCASVQSWYETLLREATATGRLPESYTSLACADAEPVLAAAAAERRRAEEAEIAEERRRQEEIAGERRRQEEIAEAAQRRAQLHEDDTTGNAMTRLAEKLRTFTNRTVAESDADIVEVCSNIRQICGGRICTVINRDIVYSTIDGRFLYSRNGRMAARALHEEFPECPPL